MCILIIATNQQIWTRFSFGKVALCSKMYVITNELRHRTISGKFGTQGNLATKLSEQGNIWKSTHCQYGKFRFSGISGHFYDTSSVWPSGFQGKFGDIRGHNDNVTVHFAIKSVSSHFKVLGVWGNLWYQGLQGDFGESDQHDYQRKFRVSGQF